MSDLVLVPMEMGSANPALKEVVDGINTAFLLMEKPENARFSREIAVNISSHVSWLMGMLKGISGELEALNRVIASKNETIASKNNEIATQAKLIEHLEKHNPNAVEQAKSAIAIAKEFTCSKCSKQFKSTHQGKKLIPLCMSCRPKKEEAAASQ